MIFSIFLTMSFNLIADQEKRPADIPKDGKVEMVDLPEIKLPEKVKKKLETIKPEGTLKLGGSSTGGGNEVSEQFKTIAHVYGTYLEQITQKERVDLDIQTTAKEIFQAINLFADDIVELSSADSMSIYDGKGNIVANIYQGQILEGHSRKDAYLGFNEHSEQKIFVSKSWDQWDTTIPLKEYLRAINRPQEIPAILNFARKFPKPDITTKSNWSLGAHRIPELLQEKSVVIEKISTAVLTQELRAKLEKIHGTGNLFHSEFATAAINSLKTSTRKAAFDYANRICGSAWDTAKYRTENYLYSNLIDFEMEESSCKIKDQLKCQTFWKATCNYGYANELPKL